MQTSVERLEGERAKLTITVPAADVDAAISAAYATVGAKLRIPGFRPGKAPRPVIDTHVGREAVLAEAQEEVVTLGYGRAVSEQNLRTFGQPDVGELDLVEPGKDFTFTAEVALRPELTLSSADDFKVTVPSKVSSDREIDAQIDYTRERFATLEAADQPVGENDFALISFTGTVDGEAYEGNSVDKYLYELGRGMMPAEFDTALVGVSAGGSAVAEFAIPDTSANEEFVGKTARFEIDVHEVKAKTLPELNDEFAATAGGFDSLDEYRADVREKLDAAKEAGHAHQVESAVLEELTSRLQGDVPAEMIEGRANTMMREFFENLESRGITVQQYMEMTGVTGEKIRDDLKGQAEVRVREELALEALARAKGIDGVTDGDIADAMREITAGDEAAAVKMRDELTENGVLPLVAEQVVHRRALKWLMDEAVVEEEQS